MAVYICSKPLQIMVALILAKPKEDSLYLVDWFSDASRIAVSPALGRRFSEVKIFSSRARAMLAAGKSRYEQVFIDSDIGFKTYFCMLFLKIAGCKLIAVYEEGVGTYRNDLIFGWRKFFFLALRGSCYFGQSPLVGRVLVFDSLRYQTLFPDSSNKVVKIPLLLQLWCERNVKLLKDVFAPGLVFDMPANTLVRIYLTDWNVDLNLVERLAQEGELYVKPHPHIREALMLGYQKKCPGVKWIPASVPAELLFVLVLNAHNAAKVYHYGSSAVYYFVSDAIIDTLLVRN